MRTVNLTDIQLSKAGEQAVRAYISGEMVNISQLAKVLSESEGRTFHRQSTVNLVATILPYWYRVGKIDLGHNKDTVGEVLQT